MSRIYINPGHGGTDSGAVGIGGRQEKDDALRYASAVANELRAAGHEVKLERDGDYYISVTDIAKKANAWGADLFIAFHRNSGGGVGAECLIVSTASETSKKMAQAIQSGLVGVGFRDRGIKVQDTRTQVLRDTKMPATTIECGFVDSQEDNDLFDGRFSEIVRGITNAILSIAGGNIAPEPTPEPERKPLNQTVIEEFVRRLYHNVLNRGADIEGWNHWMNSLLGRQITPREAAYGIIFSGEGMAQKEASEQFVVKLYLGLLGRMPDGNAEGWASGLYKDMSREDVFNGIVDSAEFKAIETQMGF